MNISQTTDALKQILSKQQQEKFSFKKFKILYPYLKKNPGLIWIVILSSIISAIVLLPVPIVTQQIIDKYIVDNNLKMIVIASVTIACLYAFNFVVKIILNYAFSVLNNKLLLSIKGDLAEKIINLPLSFFSETQSGYLVARINEINHLGSMFSMMFISLIVSGLTFLCSLFILGYLSWPLLVLTIIFLPVQYFVVRKFTGGMQSLSKTMMEKTALLNKNMQEMVSGIQTVKSFASEDKEKGKIGSSIQSVYKSSLLQGVFLGLSQEIIGFISNISSLLVLLISAILIINHQLTIGLYVACLQYVNNIFRPIQVFASAGMVMQPMIVAINRINEYFEIIGEDVNPQRNKNPKAFKGDIVFDNVSFFYENDKPVLQNVSFSINSGDRVFFLGANGTGKTTLLKLILQLYLPQKGDIYIDNVNVRTIGLPTLRGRIGLVSQDVFLFNDTIKNNLIYGCNQYTEEELNYVIGIFCSFIDTLPNGIHTLVGERGGNLSGGQKQAISVVRAILKRPDILLFDEGSSNLDDQSIVNLKRLVDEYFVGATCIFITHSNIFLNHPYKTFRVENNSVIEFVGN